MAELSAIRTRYHAIARQLGADERYARFCTCPQHDGSPHVESEGDQLHYVVTERGNEFERHRTTDPDELLFWLVCNTTWAMASDWELQHRNEDEDSRQQLFRKHVELLHEIDTQWAERMKRKYEVLLGSRFPFTGGVANG